MDLFSAIDACKTLLTPKRYKALQDFKNLIIAFREKMETENLIDVYDELLDAIKYREFMNELDNSDERLENLEEFKSILVQIETDFAQSPRATKLQEAFMKPCFRKKSPKEGVTTPRALRFPPSIPQKRPGIRLCLRHRFEENVFPNAYRFASG